MSPDRQWRELIPPPLRRALGRRRERARARRIETATARYRAAFSPPDTRVAADAHHRLAVAAAMRNEAPYLAEWIEFHRLVGVEHFYLYDDRSTDDPRAVLDRYIEDGVVTLHTLPEALPEGVDNRQSIIYDACLEEHGSACRWIAFLDLDEFLYAREEDDLREVLADYEGEVGIAVCWIFFTTSGHVLRTEGPVIERFTACDPAGYPIGKLIVDPALTVRMQTPHFGVFDFDRLAVDEQRRPSRGLVERPSVDRLRINHYWTKSVEEWFTIKVPRGNPVNVEGMRDAEGLLVVERHFGHGEDPSILRFLPALRERLGLAGQP